MPSPARGTLRPQWRTCTSVRRTLLGIQAAYFAGTGLWPILHMPSFEAVTGRKRDRWLVRVIGALALADAVALAIGAAREEPEIETRVLAIASAAAFGIIETIYAGRGSISPVYLLDAIVEGVFIAGHLAG